MEYQVSEKIQSRLSALTENASVQKALAFMKEDQDKVIEKQIELTLIIYFLFLLWSIWIC